MAQGDTGVFNNFLEDVHLKIHQLETDTIKCALVDNTITPSATTADPRWGAGGTTNLSANEVSGSNYTAGGIDITATCSESGGTVTFDGTTNPSWTQHASGPTDIYWAILYNDTATGKEAIGWVDMGGPVSLADGNVSITWHASGIYTES